MRYNPLVGELCNTQGKIKKLLEEWYPQGHINYEAINTSEKLAISTLKTGIFPFLNIHERREYNDHIDMINCLCVQNKANCIPPKLYKVKYRALIPVIQDDQHPATNQIEHYHRRLNAYKERLRLKTLEVEITEMITSGTIPKMSVDERLQVKKDLLIINELRQEEHAIPLDIEMSFDDHFRPIPFFTQEQSSFSSDSQSSDSDSDSDSDSYTNEHPRKNDIIDLMSLDEENICSKVDTMEESKKCIVTEDVYIFL